MNEGFSASSLRGAVDLSALRSAPTTSAAGTSHSTGATNIGVPAAGGEATTTVSGPFVVEVTSKNIEQILKNSMHVPVIFAFHSDRSENSQTLVSQLSEIAKSLRGRVQVGLISTDSERELTSMFGITGVPATAAVLQGQPIPLFQGLPTREEIDNTVSKLLEAAAGYGITGVLDGQDLDEEPEPELPPLHQEGQTALNNGDLEGAHAAFSRALKENPGDSDALTSLRQVELMQRVNIINPEGTSEGAQAVLEAARECPLQEIDKHLNAADVEAAYGRPDAAFGRLIDVIRDTNGEARETVRKRLIELFDVIGIHTDLVKTARKALTNALF